MKKCKKKWDWKKLRIKESSDNKWILFNTENFQLIDEPDIKMEKI